MGTRTRQAELALKYRGRGGYRPGAGRPRSGRHAVPHRSRPKVAARHPVHVTLRVRDEVWNLPSRRCFRALARGFARGNDRFGFRLIHFSVQGNHLHLIVEVADEEVGEREPLRDPPRVLRKQADVRDCRKLENFGRSCEMNLDMEQMRLAESV